MNVQARAQAFLDRDANPSFEVEDAIVYLPGGNAYESSPFRGTAKLLMRGLALGIIQGKETSDARADGTLIVVAKDNYEHLRFQVPNVYGISFRRGQQV